MSMENIINRLETVTRANEIMNELLNLDKNLFKETDILLRNKLMIKLEESIFE